MEPLCKPTQTSQVYSASHRLPHVSWSKRDVLWAVVVGFGMLAGLAVLLNVGLYWVASGTGRQELPQVGGLATLVAELALLVPVWWFGVRKYRLTWSAVGLCRFDPSRSLGLGCLFLLVAFAGNFAWSLFLSLFNLRAQPDVLPLFGGGAGGLLLAILTGGIIAPFAEEVFFRGFVFAGLHKGLGLRRALMLSAGLFALVHILPTSWPPIFLLGVLFALLYEQTGSIWPAMAVHGAMNTISFLALYVLELMKAS